MKLSKICLEFLSNKEWMITEYKTKHRTVYSIAKELGCSSISVRKRLIKYGVKIRSSLESHMINRRGDGFNLRNIDVINGSLLGDASIILDNGRFLPRFTKSNKHYAHVYYVARKTFDIFPEERIFNKKTKLNNKIYTGYTLRSVGHDFLIELRDMWYPESNKRKKIVPQSLVLTPETVLNWFLDDGWSKYRRKNGKLVIGQCYVEFCSESFSKKDNIFLCKQLAKLGIKASVVKSQHGSKCRIAISQANAKTFFEVIGPCPDELKECLGYKWKISKPFKSKFPELRDPDWMINAHVVHKKTVKQIAKDLGCSPDYVNVWLHRLEIPIFRW